MSFGTVQPLPVSELICSFPLLEDLALTTRNSRGSDTPDGREVTFQPSSSPAFNGTLELSLDKGTRDVMGRLLSLPNGFSFRKADLAWADKEGASLAAVLVERCCSTLESLEIGSKHARTFV
jgi:hypothetical protein